MGAQPDEQQEWSVQDVVRHTGTTSRTLRHYDAIGLLPPTRSGPGGVRYYDGAALVRLQRVLVLRALGMDLPTIAEVVDGEHDAAVALRHHLAQLRAEQHRLTRMAASVERTITALTTGGTLMTDTMFDGFDHTQYREEVEQRWGKRAYADSDRWWRGMSDADRARWKELSAQLGADWIAAAQAGIAPDSEQAQALARRHADWLAGIPGTPGHDAGAPPREYLLGLGEAYVADPRFAANYGGVEGATFVRDTLAVYAERNC